MALETLITTAVISAFTSQHTINLIKGFLDGLNRKEPVRQDGIKGFILEPPTNRLGVGKTILDGKEALAIYLEKSDGSAYNEAMALMRKNPSRVSVKVIGFAQAVLPTSVVQKTIHGSSRPLSVGNSVSHIHGYAGSLGAFVFFKYPRRPNIFKGLTSAAHVFGCNNSAIIGDPIISPGRPDVIADIEYKVGKLARCTYLTHYADQNDPNAILNKNDIAVAELDDETTCPETNLVIDPKNRSQPMSIKGVLDQDGLIEHLGRPLYMVSRTSGFSEGVLDGTSLAAYTIKFSNGKKYLYGDLSFVLPRHEGVPFSAPGDSGALIYTETGLAAGFLVGATDKGSLFHPAFSCLQHLNAQLI